MYTRYIYIYYNLLCNRRHVEMKQRKICSKAAKLSSEKKKSVQTEIQRALAFFSKAPDTIKKSHPEEEMNPGPDVPDMPIKNRLYPAMSDAIAFKYEASRGRYAVASRYVSFFHRSKTAFHTCQAPSHLCSPAQKVNLTFQSRISSRQKRQLFGPDVS